MNDYEEQSFNFGKFISLAMRICLISANTQTRVCLNSNRFLQVTRGFCSTANTGICKNAQESTKYESDGLFQTSRQTQKRQIYGLWLNYPGIQLSLPCTPLRTICHECQIVHWDPLNAKRRCPQNNLVWAM